MFYSPLTYCVPSPCSRVGTYSLLSLTKVQQMFDFMTGEPPFLHSIFLLIVSRTHFMRGKVCSGRRHLVMSTARGSTSFLHPAIPHPEQTHYLCTKQPIHEPMPSHPHHAGPPDECREWGNKAVPAKQYCAACRRLRYRLSIYIIT